jgi:thiol-disulfide isomerase/thioredoxin
MKAFIFWLALALASPDDAARARVIIAAATRAYQAAPAWRDRLAYRLEAPNAEPGLKRIDILLGAGKDVAVADGLFRATAVGGKLTLTKTGADSTYASAPYSGDLRRSLDALGGDRVSLFEPPPVAMRLGKSVDDCIDSFRFHQLGPLRVTRAGRESSNSGQSWDEIEMLAENGSVRARFDPGSHLLASVDLTFTPRDAPPNVVVRVSGEFAPQAVNDAASLVAFDPGSRRAVEGMAQLDATSLPTGVPLSAFTLKTLEGQPLSSSALRGRVVVVDFWASWCAPCWTTLSEVQALADWAKAGKQPVTVLTINTLERFSTEAERRSKVAALVRARRLTVPVLIDEDNKVFESFGSPGLPSTVVISPDGQIRRYHQGLEPGLEATLRSDVLGTLSADGGR